MNPGRRDRYITIQEVTETRAASGGPVNSWSDFWSCWANKSDGPGVETVNGDRIESENTVIWTTIYRSDVTTKMRIVYGDDIYNITGISEVGRRHLMKLTTKINK